MILEDTGIVLFVGKEGFTLSWPREKKYEELLVQLFWLWCIGPAKRVLHNPFA